MKVFRLWKLRGWEYGSLLPPDETVIVPEEASIHHWLPPDWVLPWGMNEDQLKQWIELVILYGSRTLKLREPHLHKFVWYKYAQLMQVTKFSILAPTAMVLSWFVAAWLISLALYNAYAWREYDHEQYIVVYKEEFWLAAKYGTKYGRPTYHHEDWPVEGHLWRQERNRLFSFGVITKEADTFYLGETWREVRRWRFVGWLAQHWEWMHAEFIGLTDRVGNNVVVLQKGYHDPYQ